MDQFKDFLTGIFLYCYYIRYLRIKSAFFLSINIFLAFCGDIFIKKFL